MFTLQTLVMLAHFCVDVEQVKQDITEASMMATAVQRWFHSSIVKWVKVTYPCVIF